MSAAEAKRASAPSAELACMTALDLLAGYRAKRFTPSDVVEDVIAALECDRCSSATSW